MHNTQFSEGFLNCINPHIDEESIQKLTNVGISAKAARTFVELQSARGMRSAKEWVKELVEGDIPLKAAEFMVQDAFK